MKVYWLDLGWMEADRNYMFAGASRGTVDNKHAPSVWGRVPIERAYIDHPIGKIMIDAGVNASLRQSRLNRYVADPEQTLEYQLSLCGVKPEDIDYLIVTHMHVDHIGEIDKFKNAKVIVQRSELIQALMAAHTHSDGSYVREDVDVDADFMVIDGDYQLADDIKLLHLPGHTDGQMGVMLTLSDGMYIFTSDAINTFEAYGPPAVAPAKAPWDSKAWRASVERVRRIVTETGVKLIFGHDQSQYFDMKKTPEYYE